MTQVRKARIGRKRWGPLVRFLTETMQTATSERTRMTAALRLADVLTLREEREQLALRRELRLAEKAVEPSQDGGQPEASPEITESAEERARAFLASIQEKYSHAANE